MATTTSSIYINVIEDVIKMVRGDFLQSGVQESLLTDLQRVLFFFLKGSSTVMGDENDGVWCDLWTIERAAQTKPVPSAAGSATGNANGVAPPVHDLNVPYDATEEYETPTAEILFPPTPLQMPTPMHTPLPGTVEQHSLYHMPTPSDYSDIGSMHDVKPGKSSPYMQPPSPWMHQRPLGVDVNVANVEGRDERDRGTSNQPMTQDFFAMSSGKRKREEFVPHFHGGVYIPQQDGAGDTAFDLFQNELYPYQTVANEDYNAVNTPATLDLQVSTPHVGAQDEGGDDDDDDEPPLNENDDDDADEVDRDDEPNTQHLVLAQFDKVTRAKSKWKFTLKDGIMHINNKDIVFNKANGEMEF